MAQYANLCLGPFSKILYWTTLLFNYSHIFQWMNCPTYTGLQTEVYIENLQKCILVKKNPAYFDAVRLHDRIRSLSTKLKEMYLWKSTLQSLPFFGKQDSFRMYVIFLMTKITELLGGKFYTFGILFPDYSS